MDARTARETVIKPKLVEMLGNTMATSLLTMAIGAGMSGANEHEKLQLMVNSICNDKRLVGMWGAAQAERQRREWSALV